MFINKKYLLRDITLYFIAALLVNVLLIPTAASWAMTAREVMEKQSSLHKVQDEQSFTDMILIDKRNKKKKRTTVSYAMETKSGLSKSMMVFKSPKDVKGTGLLTWEQKGRDDDQWLYLPASRKEKRIAASGKSNYFMGTDFAFEDMRAEDLDAHTYKILKKVTLKKHECYVIEALPSTDKEKRESGYSKRIIWIRADIFITVQTKFYDKKGRYFKKLNTSEPKKITATAYRSNKSLMVNNKKKHKTLLIIKKRSVNTGMKESLFTLNKIKGM